MTMKLKASAKGSRIPAGKVTLGARPAILACDGGVSTGSAESSLAVIPVMDGAVIRKLIIRCGCGRTAEIDCSYAEVVP
jgi:hypothetical protein